MNFLTLTFLFINIQSDPSVTDLSVSPSTTPGVIYDTFGQHVNRRSAEADALPSASPATESSTIVYQNMRGIGVKVKNVNARSNSAPSQRLEHGMKGSESSTAYSPVQPVYLPMDTLPGLDLEIDAMGLGGIPPGVRIETRNGRPVVEIVPHMDIMHSTTNEEVHDKVSNSRKDDFVPDYEQAEPPMHRKTKRRVKGKIGSNKKRMMSGSKPAPRPQLPQPTAERSEENVDEESEDHSPEADDDIADTDSVTRRPENSRRQGQKSENIRLQPESFHVMPLENASFRSYSDDQGRNVKEIKIRTNKKLSDIDLESLTKNQLPGSADAGNNDNGGDFQTPFLVSRDLSDPRISHAGRRINKSLWNYEGSYAE